MKHSLLTIIVSLSLIDLIHGQSTWADETFYINCEKGKAVWDTVTLNNQFYKYSFIKKSYAHSDQNGHDFFHGAILLNLDSKKFDSLFLSQLFSVINEKIKLENFIAFRTCEAHRLYISGLGPRNQKQKDYLRDNIIGVFDKSKINK